MTPFRAIIISAAISGAACGSRDLQPANFDPAHEPCQFCRMTGSTGRSAAQLVVPSEEPRYFDDIGCLREYLKQSRAVAASAVVYVADHRTGDWVRADGAVYVYSASTPTPMSSHLLAYASTESRDADAITGDRKTMPLADVFAGVPVPWSHEK